MKYKKYLKNLEARQNAWDKLPNNEKAANKKPGSKKK